MSGEKVAAKAILRYLWKNGPGVMPAATQIIDMEG